MVEEGIATSCSEEGKDWMLGGSSLRIGCVTSGSKLDGDVVAVGSVNAFKGELDHHLMAIPW